MRDAAVLSLLGLNSTTYTYTRMSAASYDTTQVAAPDGLRAVAVGDAAEVGLSAINVSWNDESENEVGFGMENYRFPVLGGERVRRAA